jgi:hypothetical protein
MPYLNLDLDFFDHRKTKRLVGLLGRGAEVIPIKLWSYCGKFHADTGRLTDYSEQEIETLAGWWGKTGGMLPALLRVEFIAKDTEGFFLVDWLEHQGHIAAFKAKGRLMAQARWAKAAASNAASMPQAMPYPTDPTDPSLSSAREVDDPNVWPMKPTVVVMPPIDPVWPQRIEAIHAWYGEQMGFKSAPDMQEQRLWFDWFKAGYDEEQLKTVFRYLRGQTKQAKNGRNPGAITLRNMLRPDQFKEDLRLALAAKKPIAEQKAKEIEAKPMSPQALATFGAELKKAREAIR